MNGRKGFDGEVRILADLQEETALLADPDNAYTVVVRGTDDQDLAEGAVSFVIDEARLKLVGTVNLQVGGKADTGERRRSTDK